MFAGDSVHRVRPNTCSLQFLFRKAFLYASQNKTSSPAMSMSSHWTGVHCWWCQKAVCVASSPPRIPSTEPFRFAHAARANVMSKTIQLPRNIQPLANAHQSDRGARSETHTFHVFFCLLVIFFPFLISTSKCKSFSFDLFSARNSFLLD